MSLCRCFIPNCHNPGLPVLGTPSCLEHSGLVTAIIAGYLAQCAPQQPIPVQIQQPQPVQIQQPIPVPIQQPQPVQIQQPQPILVVEVPAHIQQVGFESTDFPALPSKPKIAEELPKPKIVEEAPKTKPISPSPDEKLVGCQSGIADSRCYGDYHDLDNKWGNISCTRCYTTTRYLKYLRSRGKDAVKFNHCQGPKGGLDRPHDCDGANHSSYAKRCFACDRVGGTDVFYDMRKEMDDHAKRN